jgi:hypothetical protein
VRSFELRAELFIRSFNYEHCLILDYDPFWEPALDLIGGVKRTEPGYESFHFYYFFLPLAGGAGETVYLQVVDMKGNVVMLCAGKRLLPGEGSRKQALPCTQASVRK